MEILTHVDRVLLSIPYIVIPVSFDDGACQSLASLPDDWDGLIAPESTRFIGDNWAKSRSSLLLRVPSVVVIGEWNYLFNPDHPNMRDLHIGNPEPFRFDSRLR